MLQLASRMFIKGSYSRPIMFCCHQFSFEQCCSTNINVIFSDMKTWLIDAFIFAVLVAHVLLCPFTKVEESFGTQAIHDIVYHGFALEKVTDGRYDP